MNTTIIQPTTGSGPAVSGNPPQATNAGIYYSSKIGSNGISAVASSTQCSNGFATAIKQLIAHEPSIPKMEVKATDSSITTVFCQKEQDVTVKAELQPETGLSAIEALKLQMLMVSSMVGTPDVKNFKPISYIRENNLERHFKFSAQ